MRSGLIAEKLGMTQIFTEAGEFVPVTVLHVQDCVVLEHRTKEKHGYTAIQIGAKKAKPQSVSKPEKGQFAKANAEPRKFVKEFVVDEANLLPPGEELLASHFAEGQFIDVTGVSVGKGFAGSMKRWNFGGLRATHGVSVSHRSHGSTGNRQDPGRTFPGKKMAGHMGARQVTKMNLKVHSIDAEKGLIFIKGSVPGSAGSVVYVRDAIKKKSA